MFFKLSLKIKLLLFTILFACFFNQAFAKEPEDPITTSITCSDPKARINSTISVRVTFKSTAANTNATVNLTGISNPGINT